MKSTSQQLEDGSEIMADDNDLSFIATTEDSDALNSEPEVSCICNAIEVFDYLFNGIQFILSFDQRISLLCQLLISRWSIPKMCQMKMIHHF